MDELEKALAEAVEPKAISAADARALVKSFPERVAKGVIKELTYDIELQAKLGENCAMTTEGVSTKNAPMVEAKVREAFEPLGYTVEPKQVGINAVYFVVRW